MQPGMGFAADPAVPLYTLELASGMTEAALLQ